MGACGASWPDPLRACADAAMSKGSQPLAAAGLVGAGRRVGVWGGVVDVWGVRRPPVAKLSVAAGRAVGHVASVGVRGLALLELVGMEGAEGVVGGLGAIPNGSQG